MFEEIKEIINEIFLRNNEGTLIHNILKYLVTDYDKEDETQIKQCIHCKELKYEDGNNTWCSICDSMICFKEECYQQIAYVMYPNPRYSRDSSNFREKFIADKVLCKYCYDDIF